MDDAELVYSTDPERNKKCARCKKLKPECVCGRESKAPAVSFTAVLRIEKAGRGGKTVTVVDRLPRQHKLLDELSRLLKQKCGAGGTYGVRDGHGIIEIQGDARERIKAVLEQEGIPVKGA